MSYELRKAALKKGAAKFAERGFGKLAQKSGFTLAEMMVVMLIMSIIMAAFAPVVTTRNKSGDNSERWRWARNRSDIYYGIADTQVAMIGQNEREATDPSSKLLISTIEDGQSHILFKHATNAGAGTILGQLYMDDKGNYGLSSSQLKGSMNTAFGSGALINVTDSVAGDNGTKNTAVGYEALKNTTSGYFNTAVGELSLSENTSGSRNVSIGNSSMAKNTTGQDNVSVGVQSLLSNLSGSQNVSIGDSALHLNQTGNSNTAVGYHALYSNDNGYNNVAVGINSLNKNTSGYYNIGIGEGSLSSNTAGNSNTAVGTYSSMYPTGTGNTSLGYDSLRDVESGDYNTAVGYRANCDLSNRHSATASTAIGADAKAFNNWATALGNQANASGESSIAAGYLSVASNSWASAYGFQSQATGSMSTAIGDSAKATGDYSTALGLYSNASSSYTVAIGQGASASDSEAIAIGYMANASGGQSIAIGTLGSSVGTTASGSYSIAMGDGAMARGSDNIAIGREACANVYGSNKVCIGANSGPSGELANDSVERIYIGSEPYVKRNNVSNISATAPLEIHNDKSRGAAIVVNGTLLVRGHLAIASPHIADPRLSIVSNKKAGSDDTYNVGGFLNASDPYTNNGNPGYLSNSWISDKRLKYVGHEFTSGLDKIRELKVFNYTFKNDKAKTPHVGVIAQDLQKVFPDAVSKGDDGFLQIRLEDMFYALVNAVKELDSKITELTNQVKILQEQNKQIIKQNKAIEARLKALEAKNK